MPPAINSLSPNALPDCWPVRPLPSLLHVLPEDSWKRERVPGSRCACVYEMSFPAKVEELAAGKSAAIVVYGAGRPSLDSVVAVNQEGRLTAQAQLEIDRTLWGVNYGSGRLFAWLGPQVVNDHITLHLKIHAQLRV